MDGFRAALLGAALLVMGPRTDLADAASARALIEAAKNELGSVDVLATKQRR